MHRTSTESADGPAGEPTGSPVGSPDASVHHLARRDSGYSVVEVLVSITLFMGLAAAISMLLLTSVRGAESNDNRAIAAGLAAAQVEQARAIDAPTLLVAGTDTIVRNGTTFTVRRSLVPASGCTANLRTITISVTWPGSSVSSDTVRECVSQ